MSEERVPLAGGLIDRDAATRSSEEALEAAWADPGALLLNVHGVRVPVRDGAEGGRAGRRDEEALAFQATAAVSVPFAERIYLGKRDGTPVFAAAVEADVAVPGATWRHAFEVVAKLPPAERELLMMAFAVLRWHESAGFSPRDGAATTVADGGWARHTAQGAELFPRTDPAVIVLITHEDRVLLGSNVLWESGRFSLLAGFVEAGESLEGAVAREVFEESGMRVGEIRYVASQPWPFPRSLMLGFHAQLAPQQDPEALLPDTTEISELRWFTRDEVLNPAPGLQLPPGSVSIAGWLLENWAREGSQ